ncbi:hypothetical protein PTKIN_Ptkin03bG0094500 [Pterospermum kingtungense]
MSGHRRQASRVLPSHLTLEGDEQPPKSTDSAQPIIGIASPYGRDGSNGSTADYRSANLQQQQHPQHFSRKNSQAPAPERKPS